MQFQQFETAAEKYSSTVASTILFTDEKDLQWSHQKSQRITNCTQTTTKKKNWRQNTCTHNQRLESH